jgi:hypothetical protein
MFPKYLFFRAILVAAAGSFLFAATPLCRAQAAGDSPTIPQDLPPGAQDVVKLTQAGLNEDVIIAQVRSAGHIYRLTADQIIELTNAGVSQNVIRALIEGAAPAAAAPGASDVAPASPVVPPAPPAAPESPAVTDSTQVQGPVPGEPPAAPVNFDVFQSELSPYGMWVQSPDYGWVWVPSVATGDSGWQPYCDQGEWIYSDDGWYWNSYYPWGRIPFHYGRWTRMEGYGWAWIPDYTWGPSWVCWRYDEAGGYCGWAPLPPGAQFVAGLGLFFHGRLAVDIDFGLRWDVFIFCSFGHMFDRDLRLIVLPRERVAAIYDHTFVRNHYGLVNGRVSVEGLGRDRIEALSHRQLRPVAVGPAPARDERGRVVAPRTDASGRKEVAPATRTAPRPDGRAPESRAAPARTPASAGERAPSKESGRNAPAPEKAPPSTNSEPASDQKK